MKVIRSMLTGKRKIITLAFALIIAAVVGVGTAWAAGHHDTQVKSDTTVTVAAAPQTQTTTATSADMNVAYSLQNAFRSVSQKVLPEVVEVNVVDTVKQQVTPFASPFQYFFGPQGNNGQQPQTREYKQYGLGSGVLVRRDGNKVYVLTNNHVAGNADQITVKLYDGRQYDAKLVGSDARTDLALVVFETKEDVPIATLGDSNSLQVGDWVIAVGNPLGFESTVTSGIVSAVGRRPEAGQQISGFTDYIQTDAAINEGNSGGALVNLAGEVVGINSWIASTTGGSIGLGFAIPINLASKAIPQFIQKGHIDYGWLGVTIGDIDNGTRKDMKLGDATGAFVYSVFNDSPAAKSGVLPGDFITSVGGQAVTDSTALTQMIGNMKPGDNDSLQLIRYGNDQALQVKITARPDEQKLSKQSDSAWPGVAVVPLTSDIRSQMNIPQNVGDVIVAGTDSTGQPSVGSLQMGDVILKVGGTDVRSMLDFYKALNSQNGRRVSVTVNRQGAEMTLNLSK